MGAVDKQDISYCEVCFEKQQKIDVLYEEVIRLQAKLNLQERKAPRRGHCI